uniref:Uncharacterized protein n=1 Tax=Arundo donax TaxID=35708 RepID=A0A0A8XZU5_ARUDO
MGKEKYFLEYFNI